MFYDRLMEERRSREEREQEERRLARIRAKEEKNKHDDRHWSKKALEDMNVALKLDPKNVVILERCKKLSCKVKDKAAEKEVERRVEGIEWSKRGS